MSEYAPPPPEPPAADYEAPPDDLDWWEWDPEPDPWHTDHPTDTPPEADDALEDRLDAAAEFARAVARESHNLRVRAAARDAVAAEKAGEQPPFDAGTLAEILGRPDSPPHRIEELVPSGASALIVAQQFGSRWVRALKRTEFCHDCEHPSIAAAGGLTLVMTGPAGALALTCRPLAVAMLGPAGRAGSDLIGA